MKQIFGLLIIPLILIACSDDPTSIGSQLIPGSDYINFSFLDSFTDSLSQSSSFFVDKIPLGRSTKILLGKNENLESWILTRFYILLPDSISHPLQNDSLNILSASVEMRPSYLFGDSNGIFDFTVHRVYNAWTPGGFDKDSMSTLNYEGSDFSSLRSITDSVITFDIDRSLVLDWMKRTYDENIQENHGIVFIPTQNTERIFGFPAYDDYSTEFLPRLSIVVEKPGSFVDTVLAITFSDVHAVRGNSPTGSPENILLQGGLVTHGKLYFDLSRIPLYSIVNRATLELFVDTMETSNGSPAADSIKVFIFSDTTSKALYDSTSYQFLVRDSSATTFNGEVTKLVQEWINGVENQGFRLNVSDEERAVNKVAVKGSTTTEADARPRLNIIYSEKK